MTSYIECPECKGHKHIIVKDPKTQKVRTEECKPCGGTGHVPMPEETHIRPRDRVRDW